MTKITINNTNVFYRSIPEIKSVEFDHLGHKVYSAQKIERIYGVFASLPIDGSSSLVSWGNLIWYGTKPAGTDIWVYVKSASTLDGLENAAWIGPFLNGDDGTSSSSSEERGNISDVKNRYLQVIVVLVNNASAVPVLSSLKISCYSSQNAARFYSSAFNLGFVPKHVLLTYNGDLSPDSILRFAVSGFDTTDSNEYQYIDPNKIEELTELSMLSNKIKLMIEMIGDSGVPIVVDEVALMFSGDSQLYLNEEDSSSSSSSSS